MSHDCTDPGAQGTAHAAADSAGGAKGVRRGRLREGHHSWHRRIVGRRQGVGDQALRHQTRPVPRGGPVDDSRRGNDHSRPRRDRAELPAGPADRVGHRPRRPHGSAPAHRDDQPRRPGAAPESGDGSGRHVSRGDHRRTRRPAAGRPAQCGAHGHREPALPAAVPRPRRCLRRGHRAALRARGARHDRDRAPEHRRHLRVRRDARWAAVLRDGVAHRRDAARADRAGQARMEDRPLRHRARRRERVHPQRDSQRLSRGRHRRISRRGRTLSLHRQPEERRYRGDRNSA